mmetsp:Transcript_32074/g.76228  ORF Transcript_32074/g.76228 Transcript_32074/m.76228 type:complete len:202 (+) Transcript_32074:1158-1763(+)
MAMAPTKDARSPLRVGESSELASAPTASTMAPATPKHVPRSSPLEMGLRRQRAPAERTMGVVDTMKRLCGSEVFWMPHTKAPKWTARQAPLAARIHPLSIVLRRLSADILRHSNMASGIRSTDVNCSRQAARFTGGTSGMDRKTTGAEETARIPTARKGQEYHGAVCALGLFCSNKRTLSSHSRHSSLSLLSWRFSMFKGC